MSHKVPVKTAQDLEEIKETARETNEAVVLGEATEKGINQASEDKRVTEDSYISGIPYVTEMYPRNLSLLSKLVQDLFVLWEGPPAFLPRFPPSKNSARVWCATDRLCEFLNFVRALRVD